MNRNSLLWMGGGLTALAAFFYRREISNVADDVIDTIVPTTTGKRAIDKILPNLQQASAASGIPLGLMIGWISKESGGRLDETTKYDERGLFQLMPDESKSLGLDHQRLSTDVDYSIQGGVALIKKYMGQAAALGIAPPNSSYFWRLVKLIHTMGLGSVQKIVAMAKAAGATGSWDALEQYALANNDTILSAVKHAPDKWFPLVDDVYKIGAPFGFGSDALPLVASMTVNTNGGGA